MFSKLDALDIWLGLATLTVIVGVALEASEDIQRVREKYLWHERDPWKPILSKIGLVLLVLGLAAELVFQTDIQVREIRQKVRTERLLANERDSRVRLQYEIARIIGGRHVKVRQGFASLLRLKYPTVLIQNIEPDSEADRLAGELAWALQTWKPQRVDGTYTHIGNSAIGDGVTIYCLDWQLYNPSSGSPTTPIENAAQAAQQLGSFLSGTENQVSFQIRPLSLDKSRRDISFDVLAGTILVLIGRNPIIEDIAKLLPRTGPPPSRHGPQFMSGYVDKPAKQ